MGNGVNMMMPEKNETGFECKMNETDAYCQLSGMLYCLGNIHQLLLYKSPSSTNLDFSNYVRHCALGAITNNLENEI